MQILSSHSDWKTWKNGKAFSSQGKKSQGILNRLEKSGKITQNTGKKQNIKRILEKNQNIKRILEKWKKNSGKVREFCQSGKVGTMRYILRIVHEISSYKRSM